MKAVYIDDEDEVSIPIGVPQEYREKYRDIECLRILLQNREDTVWY
ncbi:MAG: hypothetical protein BAJATHORv1_60051 [Candidatus Thorarchaeota archaeon]|nr:MAG: hypothetical protein BAJATHORv1_60051 [Candidatus Thorarchaeota archaeon]